MKTLFTVSAVGAAGLAIAAYVTFGPGKLTYEGKTVDTTFIVQNGKTYVPLDDVASALNCVVQKSADGVELAPIGKGAMVQGTEGKIGQTIGHPEMQFTVTKVIEADHYQRKYSDGAVDGDQTNTLLVIYCRVRSGTQKSIWINITGGDKTAVADMDEHTYTLFTADGARNSEVLPGAVVDYGIIFKVPKDEKLKALVYETDGFPHHDLFRVALADWDQHQGG